MSDSNSQLDIEWRGRERYNLTWQRQLELQALRRAGHIPDTLVLVEHEPVITLGRHGDQANLLLREQDLAARGVDLHRVERGGDITYHGPGQLVGYPILDLRERGLTVRSLMRNLEEMLIRAMTHWEIEAGRIKGLTGVWHPQGKLAALGVAVQGGVSFHGFALNVDPDMTHFQLIVPCGIVGKPVTSMSQILSRQLALSEVYPVCVSEFVEVFGYTGLHARFRSPTS